MIHRFAIFGATGDLTARYLLPAIGSLHAKGGLPDRFEVLGIAHDDLDTESFRKRIGQALLEKAPRMEPTLREAVVSRLEYRRADVDRPEQVAAALDREREPIVAYLALPPVFFAPAIRALAMHELPAGSRIVVEKPFGEDLNSACELNRLLHQSFPEDAVFRLDHFLGRQTVQNLLGLRFANRIFEPLWNRTHIERVEIAWDETLALEGRASYYDSTGALKDMVQNHLLQLLALVAMEAPITLTERDFRDRKADVFRAVRRLTPEQVERQTQRGRYTAGRIGDREIISYSHENGVDPSRETETFAQVVLHIDNWRWAGVPFVLHSGKGLGVQRKEIAIHFQPVPHLAFGQQEDPAANVLRLQIDPDRMALEININGVGDPFLLERSELAAELAAAEVPAYGRLLLDVIGGQPTFTIRDDEAEESWKIIEPILKAWAAGRVPLLEYPAGSSGPQPAESKSGS
jgi:glucose-6-phosphate 1-dehydrogenase